MDIIDRYEIKTEERGTYSWNTGSHLIWEISFILDFALISLQTYSSLVSVHRLLLLVIQSIISFSTLSVQLHAPLNRSLPLPLLVVKLKWPLSQRNIINNTSPCLNRCPACHMSNISTFQQHRLTGCRSRQCLWSEVPLSFEMSGVV